MAKASGSGHGMELIKEVTYGVTPATPTLTPIRHVSTTLGLTKETFETNEIRSDRAFTDMRHGNKQVGGDIVTELSYGGAFDDLLEAALGGTWATDTPSAGIDELKFGVALGSFTIRRRFTDIATQQVFTGVKMSGFTLSAQINAPVTLTFSTLGKSMGTTDLSGESIADVTTTSPFSGLDVGSINEGGSVIALILGVEMALVNGLEPTFVLGSDTSDVPTQGRSKITGTITARFEDQVLLDKFVNETESSLDFVLTDLDGNTYKFDLPRIKYTGGQPDVSGEGAIILSLPFAALHDSTDATNLIIQRNPI